MRMPPCVFQSTLPLRGATHPQTDSRALLAISIHAPLTGSDPRRSGGRRLLRHFNPRSPYGERLVLNGPTLNGFKFQSTLPLRGATIMQAVNAQKHSISIHAPLTGSDPARPSRKEQAHDFNPRSPYGERLVGGIDLFDLFSISIHAPLTGSDR